MGLFGWLGRRPVVLGISVVGLGVVAGAGWLVWDQTHVSDIPPTWAVPAARQLTASPDEQIFRVHARRSEVAYDVEERLAGVSRTAHGTTSGIAGDIAFNAAAPAQSRFGPIVVDVQQLSSDEGLRDRRLRHDFLESGKYPLATFSPVAVDGLDDPDLLRGAPAEVEIRGVLGVKTTTAPVTFTGSVTKTADAIHLIAEADVKLSTFDVGPIELIGLVKTSDDARLSLDVTFVDPSKAAIPATVLAPEQKVETASGDTSFRDDVMPILRDNCASCHSGEGVGAHVWELASARDAADVASGLALVTGADYMPPWPASDKSVPFADERRLSESEKQAIVEWAQGGGTLDVDESTPIAAPARTPSDFTANLRLTLSEPYVGSSDQVDDYRCFILEPAFTEATWIRGYTFVADEPSIVHHALGFRVDAAAADSFRAKDAQSPGSGWDCDGNGAMGGQFMAWAPGQDPTVFPDGTAMRFEPGTALVAQIHYHFGAHAAPPDQSHFEFLTSTDPDLAPVDYRVLLAPAEIPCRAGLEEGPLCDRTAAKADASARLDPLAGLVADFLNQRCGATPADYASMTDGVASASCEHRIRRDAEAIAVFGHMHEIGETFRMTLNPGTANEKVLLDIPRWDFGWQLNYRFAQPVQLAQGDTIKVECSWDRAHLRVPEARYILWSEGTADEMCYSALTLVPTPGQASGGRDTQAAVGVPR